MEKIVRTGRDQRMVTEEPPMAQQGVGEGERECVRVTRDTTYNASGGEGRQGSDLGV